MERSSGLKVLFIVLILFCSCNKNDTNISLPPPPPQIGTNEITFINGTCNLYVNNTIKLNPHISYYISNHQETFVQQLIDTPFVSVSIYFPSKTTGVYTKNDIISVASSDSSSYNCYSKTYFYPPNFINDSTSINVTKYESVGGLIEGTWFARVHIMFDSTQTANLKGKFSIIRGSDL